MTITTGQFIVWIVVGALAGTLADWLLRGRRGRSNLIRNILVGMIGALVGGFIFDVLNISIGGELAFSASDLAAAVLGSLVVLVLIGFLRR